MSEDSFIFTEEQANVLVRKARIFWPEDIFDKNYPKRLDQYRYTLLNSIGSYRYDLTKDLMNGNLIDKNHNSLFIDVVFLAYIYITHIYMKRMAAFNGDCDRSIAFVKSEIMTRETTERTSERDNVSLSVKNAYINDVQFKYCLDIIRLWSVNTNSFIDKISKFDISTEAGLELSKKALDDAIQL